MAQYLDPSVDQASAMMDKDSEQPLAVLNLFKFNDKAAYDAEDPEYGSADAEISGQEAFARYSAVAGAYLQSLGGGVRFSVPVEQVMIGPEGDWDVAAIMLFPTRAAFMRMLSDPEFQTASRHRKAALANHYMLHLDGTSFFAEEAGETA
ncbi:MAG: DUF1330 domain-containing protein [Pseudomonadota bacterium]